MNEVRIAVIGDIHLGFNQVDIEYFNSSDYHLILFVGDLGVIWKPKSSLEIAERISKLEKPAVVIPGNHDVQNALQFIAEILLNRLLGRLSSSKHIEHQHQLKKQLRSVMLGGYSNHPFVINGIKFDVIAARPYAMGGSELSYQPLLNKKYQVYSIQDSINLLKKQVDSTTSDQLIFLAHNGPMGLGEQPTDIWGCDFNPDRGDFGDQDLSDAVKYAISAGKNVLAVVAGHMHHQTFLGPKPFWQLRGTPGLLRPWLVVEDNILFVNAARTPRIYIQGNKTFHHHICLQIKGDEISADERLIESILRA